MTKREHRLADFQSDGAPSPDVPMQLLCEDHCGTYTLPFACQWSSGRWLNAATGFAVEVDVVGWRESPADRPSRPHWAHQLSSLKAPRRLHPRSVE